VPYLGQAASLLIEVIFGALALVFLLRLLVQWVGVNFHNPICQGLYRFTNPVLMPLRRWIKAWRRIDLAAALATLGILWVKAALVLAVAGFAPKPAAVALLGVAETLALALMLYFWLILIRVLMSWVGGGHHPLVPLVLQLTEPLLRPLRRRLPAPGGLDLSPMLVTLGILLLRILLVAPLLDLAVSLAA